MRERHLYHDVWTTARRVIDLFDPHDARNLAVRDLVSGVFATHDADGVWSLTMALAWRIEQDLNIPANARIGRITLAPQTPQRIVLAARVLIAAVNDDLGRTTSVLGSPGAVDLDRCVQVIVGLLQLRAGLLNSPGRVPGSTGVDHDEDTASS